MSKMKPLGVTEPRYVTRYHAYTMHPYEIQEISVVAESPVSLRYVLPGGETRCMPKASSTHQTWVTRKEAVEFLINMATEDMRKARLSLEKAEKFLESVGL